MSEKMGAIRTLVVDWPHAPDDQVLLNSPLCVITVGDLRTLQREADGMREALAGLEQFFERPGENSIEGFNRIAAQFYRETGVMAPGKDAPAAGGQPEREERRERYDAWVAEKVAAARAFLPPQERG